MLIENNGVLKIEQDNQNTYRTPEYSFGELRMRGVHIQYVLCAQIHRYNFLRHENHIFSGLYQSDWLASQSAVTGLTNMRDDSN